MSSSNHISEKLRKPFLAVSEQSLSHSVESDILRGLMRHSLILSEKQALVSALLSKNMSDTRSLLLASDAPLELASEAARKLGEMWLEDQCRFVDVGIGVSILKEIISGKEFSTANPYSRLNAKGSILLTSVRGECHNFGLDIVANAFRAEGWHVDLVNITEREKMRTHLTRTIYDLIGFTLSCTDLVENLREDVTMLRSNLPESTKIIVGGEGVSAVDCFATGVDAVFSSCKAAIEYAAIVTSGGGAKHEQYIS